MRLDLGDRRMGFISEEFRSLMLEIWRVKYLQMPRFREVDQLESAGDSAGAFPE